MRVVFRVDASEVIGSGHAMRCLTLADALRSSGAETAFVSAALPSPLRERIAASGHRLADIGDPLWLDRLGDNWETARLNAAERAADLESTIAAIGARADWLVVDHYLLDRDWESAVRSAAAQILVIDDLANRPHDCDALVDQTLGRDESDYRALVPETAQLLCGSLFALLRPEFARERPTALKRRREPRPVRQVLVSLGSMDAGALTVPAVQAVLDTLRDCAIDVALSDAAPTLDEVRRLAAQSRAVQLHVNSHSMAELMRDADLAIGASGTSSWERCCLGLPAITFAVAENQKLTANQLHEAGASLSVGSIADLREALPRLANDAELLARMSAAAFAVTDGAGASRVARRMIEGRAPSQAWPVALRRAEDGDSERLWLWRNDTETRAASRGSAPIPWRGHVEWLKSAMADPHRRIYIAEAGGAPVGMVRFDRVADVPNGFELSINVAPEARGSGLGRAMLEQACARAVAEIGAKTLLASVQRANAASRRIFQACGFVPDGSAEGEFERYRLQLDADR